MADWVAPSKSFDAASLTNAQSGSTLDLRRVLTDHAVQWVVSWVTGTAFSVSLEGSLDGTDWYGLGADYSIGAPSGGPGGTSLLRVVSLLPCRYVRAAANVTAGTLTVTAWLTSRE